MQFAAVKFSFRITQEMPVKFLRLAMSGLNLCRNSKMRAANFYKFNAPRYVPKCAVSAMQLAVQGSYAILSCADLRSIPLKLNFKM